MRQAYVGTQVIKRFARFLISPYVGFLYAIHAMIWMVVLLMVLNVVAGDPMDILTF